MNSIKILTLSFSLSTTLFSLLLLNSCQKQGSSRINPPTTAEECDNIGLKKFKGFPNESFLYKNHCEKKIQHTYTPYLCQKILESFMMNGDVNALKDSFGNRAKECLTGDDIKRFQK